jgi:HPt (histidine-containing phosphotransfer) domain-containing protein
MLRRLQHDREHAVELIEMFLDVFPEMLDEIRSAVDLQDACRLRESAHRFWGALSQVHAPAASAAALQLEYDGRDALIHYADAHLDRLNSEVSRLCSLLESLVANNLED